MQALKNWLGQSPLLVRVVDGLRGQTTTLNVLRTFPLFVPFSAGGYRDRAALTIQTIDQVFPFLCRFCERLHGRLAEPQPIRDVPVSTGEKASVARLKELLDHHGSDKARDHDYHYLYGTILADANRVRHILEVGLGTNNTDVVSNMGRAGRPGASLRAFRDLCPAARVFGADLDERILFTEDRIKTYFVDQTNLASFDQLATQLPIGDFDLVIDDGLHSPNANIATLAFGLAAVRKGGWVVVEDIGLAALEFWQVVAALLPPKFAARLFRSGGFLVFAVQRLE